MPVSDTGGLADAVGEVEFANYNLIRARHFSP